jgi:ABC-type transport system substrate-binding protein
MGIRKLLVLTPLVLFGVLMQSYFWVPSFEEQTKGNPYRLKEFITGSIGDASILNPILAADSASSNINSLVFEGLIDRDEELRFRGRLATRWEIWEEALFRYAGPPKGAQGSVSRPADLIPWLRDRISDWPNVREIQLVDEPTRKTKVPSSLLGTAFKGSLEVEISPPPLIKITLKKVDPDFFKRLEPILGAGYFDRFSPERYCRFSATLSPEQKRRISRELLPAVEHHPVVLFHLRRGVRFHDGHPFTARDVVFTYEALMDPNNLSPRTPDFEPVLKVEALDDFTVRVEYKRLYSPALATWSIGILPEHLLNKKRLAEEARRRGMDPEDFSIRQSSFNRNPIGCGPFRFVEWKSDRYIILERFEDYWEGPPNYEKYVFRIIPDLLNQEMEFYAGALDSYAVQPHQVRRLSADPRFQAFSGLSFGYTYIGYNLRREPFNDVRVRRALGMAINVDEIIQFILYGQGERITGPFPKQTDYYDHSIEPLPYDPEGALKLLEEAGWRRDPSSGKLLKNGKLMRFTLITNSGNDIRKAILSVVQNSWKKLGIEVSTDVLEWAVFIKERINKHDFDAVILGWSMGIEPDLYQIWHSSQTGPYQLNFVGFKDPRADDLIIRIRQEYDHKRQVELCHKLHRLIADLQPYTFLFVSKWTAVLDRRIVIKEVDETGRVTYRKITPTKTGDYTFYFNKWIKLPTVPVFSAEG